MSEWECKSVLRELQSQMCPQLNKQKWMCSYFLLIYPCKDARYLLILSVPLFLSFSSPCHNNLHNPLCCFLFIIPHRFSQPLMNHAELFHSHTHAGKCYTAQSIYCFERCTDLALTVFGGTVTHSIASS